MSDERHDGDGALPDLDRLRERIDELDQQLVELLNARAEIVVEVGAFKRGTGSPIYAPDRESLVLRKVLESSRGPLGDRALEAVYRELMSGSFALERPLRIGYLGPAGSFSHAAAVAQFGSSVAFEDLHEIAGVFAEVARGHVDYGLVPIENSVGGGIVETLDAFRDRPGGVGVGAEVLISIRHQLLANCQPNEVHQIHSKPEIFTQCRRWVRTQYPSAALVPAPSSAAAAKIAAEAHTRDPSSGVAAIGSTLSGKLYGLRVLFESIEDKPDNVTRFFVLSREQPGPTGRDKSSVMFRTDHEPGALVSVLQIFAESGVNLTHIDKRPSGGENWSYTFFIDLEGHRDDPHVRDALDRARSRCQELVVLGSYPVAQRVL
jgi:chorismate mutase/prephenate dehydratase